MIYKCNNLTLEYPRVELGRRNATDSILWIAIIPTFDEIKMESEYLYTWMVYSGISSCDKIDVSLMVDGNNLKPISIDGKNQSCRYGWDIRFEEIENILMRFNPIRSCIIPDLEIEKHYDYSYENHFRPW